MSLLKNDPSEEISYQILNALKKFAGEKEEDVCSAKQTTKKKATKKTKKDELKSSKEELIEKLKASGKVKMKPQQPVIQTLSCCPKVKSITEIEKPKASGHLISGTVQKLYKGTIEEAVAKFEKEFGFKASLIDGRYFNKCDGCDCVITSSSKVARYDDKLYCSKCKKKIDEAIKTMTQGKV